MADWEQHPDEIGVDHDAAAGSKRFRSVEPCIEYYRNQLELLLMVAIV